MCLWFTASSAVLPRQSTDRRYIEKSSEPMITLDSSLDAIYCLGISPIMHASAVMPLRHMTKLIPWLQLYDILKYRYRVFRSLRK